MTKIFDLVPGWLWAIAVAVLLALLGVDTVRIADKKAALSEAIAATANLKTEYAQAAQKAEAEARAEEARRTEATKQVISDAQSQTAVAQTAALDAARAADGLRGRVAALIASSRASATNPGAAGRGPGQQGADALDVLGRVLSESDEAAGVVAAYADRLRIAGQACEAQYDSLTAPSRR